MAEFLEDVAIVQTVTRAQIVECARTYIRTPFGRQGRLKGRRLDCVGLPICVGTELGLRDKNGELFARYMEADYPAQPIGNLVHTRIARRLIEKPWPGPFEIGDVLELRHRRPGGDLGDPCHVAIVMSLPGGLAGIIHTHAAARRCVEHILDDDWRNRISAVFSFPGVSD